jgi:hypothetical protein
MVHSAVFVALSRTGYTYKHGRLRGCGFAHETPRSTSAPHRCAQPGLTDMCGGRSASAGPFSHETRKNLIK